MLIYFKWSCIILMILAYFPPIIILMLVKRCCTDFINSFSRLIMIGNILLTTYVISVLCTNYPIYYSKLEKVESQAVIIGFRLIQLAIFIFFSIIAMGVIFIFISLIKSPKIHNILSFGK